MFTIKPQNCTATSAGAAPLCSRLTAFSTYAESAPLNTAHGQDMTQT